MANLSFVRTMLVLEQLERLGMLFPHSLYHLSIIQHPCLILRLEHLHLSVVLLPHCLGALLMLLLYSSQVSLHCSLEGFDVLPILS